MSVFEVLASADAEEQERKEATRAVIVTQERVKTQFDKFVGKARNDDDRATRLAMVDDQLRKIAIDVANEYGVDDEERLYLAATTVLGGGHKSDCGCGFCKNKGKLPGAKKDDDGESDEKEDKSNDDDKDSGKPWEKEAADKKCAKCGDALADMGAGAYTCPGCGYIGGESKKEKGSSISKEAAGTAIWHTAADVETGDTFVVERESLPSSTTGLGDPSPKIDKSKVPAGGLKAVEAPSARRPVEQQGMHQEPDYGKELPGPSSTGTSADVATKSGPDSGARTDTWTGTKGLADPVTSRIAKWAVTG